MKHGNMIVAFVFAAVSGICMAAGLALLTHE